MTHHDDPVAQITGELRGLADNVAELSAHTRAQADAAVQIAERQHIRIEQVENQRRWTPTTIFTLTMVVIFLACLVGLGIVTIGGLLGAGG